MGGNNPRPGSAASSMTRFRSIRRRNLGERLRGPTVCRFEGPVGGRCFSVARDEPAPRVRSGCIARPDVQRTGMGQLLRVAPRRCFHPTAIGNVHQARRGRLLRHRRGRLLRCVRRLCHPATVAPAVITPEIAAGVAPIAVTPPALTSAVLAPAAVPSTMFRNPAVMAVVGIAVELVGIGRVNLRHRGQRVCRDHNSRGREDCPGQEGASKPGVLCAIDGDPLVGSIIGQRLSIRGIPNRSLPGVRITLAC
jgi:hypothetical protein